MFNLKRGANATFLSPSLSLTHPPLPLGLSPTHPPFPLGLPLTRALSDGLMEAAVLEKEEVLALPIRIRHR